MPEQGARVRVGVCVGLHGVGAAWGLRLHVRGCCDAVCAW